VPAETIGDPLDVDIYPDTERAVRSENPLISGCRCICNQGLSNSLGPRMLEHEVSHLRSDAFEREETCKLARDVAAVQSEAVGCG